MRIPVENQKAPDYREREGSTFAIPDLELDFPVGHTLLSHAEAANLAVIQTPWGPQITYAVAKVDRNGGDYDAVGLFHTMDSAMAREMGEAMVKLADEIDGKPSAQQPSQPRPGLLARLKEALS